MQVQAPTTQPVTLVDAVPEWQRPVVRVPLAQAFPLLGEVKEFKNRVCLLSHDRTKCFDVVSDRYQLVEHATAVAAMQDAWVKTFGAKAMPLNIRTTKDGARLFATAVLPIPHLVLAKGDVTEFNLNIVNSYDRSRVFSAGLGGKRLVCTNGMKLGASFGSIAQRHVGATDADGELTDGNDSIIDSLGRLVARAPLVKRIWEQWVDTKVEREQAEAALHWLPGMYSKPLLEAERWKRPQTVWEFYNGLTHMSSHLTKTLQRRQDFEDAIEAMFYGSKQPAFLDAVEWPEELEAAE